MKKYTLELLHGIIYIFIATFLKQFFQDMAIIIVILCYIAAKLDFINKDR